MAKINSSTLKQIQGALLNAFSSSDQLRQLARLELNENLEEIAGDGNLRLQVFELVVWAERTNRIEALVAGALAQNPNNTALRELADALASGALRPKLPGAAGPADGAQTPEFHDIPFIGPVPFDARTTDLFFGRSAEVDRLAHRLQTRSVPLLVVNGLSGSGKTSLLRAGLIPRLEEKGIAVIYASILDSPHSDLLHAITRSSGVSARNGEQDCIAAIDQRLREEQASVLVLIVDQLERCFTHRTTEKENTDFWRAVARVVRGDASLPVKLVLSVRSDWLYACQTISPSPVDVPMFDYLFLVEPLTGEQARAALTGPLDKFHVAYDDTVISRIVEDLCSDEGFVHPPQLQVVGGALYEYIAARQTGSESLHLTLDDYTALEGASAILRHHLLRILKSLGPRESAGWQILLRLIGSDDVRINRHEDELRGNLSEEMFHPVIQSLVRHAVVVRDISTSDGHPVYTLTHDYLIGEIKQHFEYDDRLQALRVSEHYLAAGLDDNRRAQALQADFLPLEHQRYVHIWRNHADLDGINPEATRFLALTALWHGEPSFAGWLARLPGASLQETARTMRTLCRQQLANGNEQPIAAIKAAARAGMPPDAQAALKSSLLAAFAPGQAGVEPDRMVGTAKQDDASRGPFASALWSMRRALKPGEVAAIFPALTQHWFQANRTPLLSAAAGIVLLAALLAVTWFVQDRLAGHWVRGAPLHAGSVSSFAVAPGPELSLYAATDRGRTIGQATSVFGGNLTPTQWSALGQSIAAEPIQDLVAAGSGANSAVYAAIRGRGIYRRQGDSNEWQLVNRGLNTYDIADMAADPDDPHHLYVAAGNSSGVFESRDGGDSWSDISGESLFGVSTTAISFSRADTDAAAAGDWVVAGTADGRIFRKQRNVDEEWQPVAAFPGTGAILTIAWEPVSGDFLLAGTSTGKILISFDAGASWGFLTEPLNIYAISSIAIMPGAPDQVFLLAYGVGGHTIWRSIDEAYTWQLAEGAHFSREYMRLVVGPPSSNLLFAYGGPGLFVSEDFGDSWRWLDTLGAPLAAVRDVVVSPVSGGPTYFTLEGSLYTVADPQQGPWSRGEGLPALAMRDVAPDPHDAQVAYAGIYVPNRWSVYTTADGGLNWQATPKPDAIEERLLDDATAIAIGGQGDTQVLYVGTASCGVIHSLDRGQTWETFGRTGCEVGDGPYAVGDIAVAPADAGTIYVAADGVMVFSSGDRGRSWRSTRLPITNRITAIAADRQRPDRVYVIAGSDGMWRSDNGGADWINVSAGLEDRALAGMAVGRSANEVYVVATNGDAWFSAGGGDEWQSLRRDLPAKTGTGIALTDDDVVVLTTEGAGHYFLRRGSLFDEGGSP